MATEAASPAGKHAGLVPTPRGIKFHLPPERVLDWHPLGQHASAVFAALSLMVRRALRARLHRGAFIGFVCHSAHTAGGDLGPQLRRQRHVTRR